MRSYWNSMCACVHAQLGQTLCDLMDNSPPSSSVHGIFLARRLEWVAIPFSKGFFQPRDQTCTPALAGGFFYHRSTSSKSSVWCLCVKRDTQGECHMKTEEESGVCIYKPRNTKCCWQARKAGRGKAWLSLRASRARQPR